MFGFRIKSVQQFARSFDTDTHLDILLSVLYNNESPSDDTLSLEKEPCYKD